MAAIDQFQENTKIFLEFLHDLICTNEIISLTYAEWVLIRFFGFAVGLPLLVYLVIYTYIKRILKRDHEEWKRKMQTNEVLK